MKKGYLYRLFAFFTWFDALFFLWCRLGRRDDLYGRGGSHGAADRIAAQRHAALLPHAEGAEPDPRTDHALRTAAQDARGPGAVARVHVHVPGE